MAQGANKHILGLSAFYHDSAAALVSDGEIVAAAQEERFTRKKHDAQFPARAIAYCLEEAKISLADLSAVVFYDKPFIKFERLLETYLAYAPRGFRSFVAAMPVWLKEKLFIKETIKRELCRLSGLKRAQLPKLLFAEHHQSHAASAFFPSPFANAAVLCIDGVGEWATTTLWHGRGNKLELKWELDFPHSLGMLYSAFTYYTGFKVNSGEYKLMGLAPYGRPKYVDLIFKHLIDLKEDGTFRLNMEYFNFATGLTMTNDAFAKCFGGPPRKPEAPVTEREMDLARSIQAVTEEVILRLCRTARKETGESKLCLAGGVALNCVANGRILRDGPFDDLWIQPAAGDAGGALGAALAGWFQFFDRPRTSVTPTDAMKGSYLGPLIKKDDTLTYFDRVGAKYVRLSDEDLFARLVEILEAGNVVGWVQGRMEFGPRSLGGRSILGDARNTKMQSTMNLKIKYRESFRPFAPAVLADEVDKFFEIDRPSPYMLLVAPVQSSIRTEATGTDESLFGIAKLNAVRSSIPAVTHVDYSARIQTVHSETNPRFHRLLSEFHRRTDCPVLVNTSFNVRGEPIVCTSEDAYRCFMRTEMDYLVVEDFLLTKSEQPTFSDESHWRNEFELD